MRKIWWKFLAAGLLLYTVIFGLIGEVPRQPILNETIRNVYFHVPMWFGMMALMISSLVYSIKYLRNGQVQDDVYAVEFANVAIIFGVLGFITGSIWGNYTWGDPLPKDPKIIAVEVGLLIYSAYFVLRGSFEDEQKKARLSAVYNIFAFASFMPLVWILPRLTDSLHPGNGGNPAFGKYDMDSNMRMVFYPAILAWILVGVWISSLRIRIKLLNNHLQDNL
ncbi:ABC transporter permease [Lacihabitans sp. CCS-44]|jgi:heme exporter protein C|uniref:cytochrome c biogenesis protein CcsA n=1 Tax=Lacihabitans sp. CCS-44 TaxID=2487331 RepID=UPI0020CB99B5|nr:cytochrome c biogenesis protein CcsA [Lacihabitans sp. CCS-44]MCP9756308.1 ABC transporter permease [Lacihabitans sp. CCS-44]